MADTIIETRLVAKHFGGLHAVDGVDLQVAEGAMHSIIGPNGAGKTTLFNLISGYLRPTSGQVFLRGARDHWPPAAPHGPSGDRTLVPDHEHLPYLTVLENVRLSAQALGRDNYKMWTPAQRFSRYQDQALQALGEVGLEAKADTLASILPHGDKRKLEMAIILAGDPQVLLLDEPTAGMASEQVPALVAMIARIRAAGNKTIILVEHNMSIVMNISDRITVMHQGKVLAEATRPRSLRTRLCSGPIWGIA